MSCCSREEVFRGVNTKKHTTQANEATLVKSDIRQNGSERYNVCSQSRASCSNSPRAGQTSVEKTLSCAAKKRAIVGADARLLEASVISWHRSCVLCVLYYFVGSNHQLKWQQTAKLITCTGCLLWCSSIVPYILPAFFFIENSNWILISNVKKKSGRNMKHMDLGQSGGARSASYMQRCQTVVPTIATPLSWRSTLAQ